ncbi:hypothetical protein Fmac_003965 [Flemingia macrophylla]|uniref:Uncharacterized protein n=1 Tax=Flemingia macrophylla TaxID=520843 RepID=A0ABD1N675_9FABA
MSHSNFLCMFYIFIFQNKLLDGCTPTARPFHRYDIRSLSLRLFWHVDDIDQAMTFQGEGITLLYMQPGQEEPEVLECPILVTFFLPGPHNPFAHLIPPEERDETPSPENPFHQAQPLLVPPPI